MDCPQEFTACGLASHLVRWAHHV